MFATLLKRTCAGNPSAKISQINRLSQFNQMNTMASVSFTRRYAGNVTKKIPISTESDDLSKQETISLEEFYSTVSDFTLSDDKALEYMHFAAKLAVLEFKDEEEML